MYRQRRHCVCIFEEGNNSNTVLKGLGIGNYYQWHKNPKRIRMGGTQTFHVCPCFTPQDSSVGTEKGITLTHLLFIP